MLETERLTLRELALCDTEFLYKLMNSPLYIKNIGDRNIHSLADATSFLTNNIISSYQKHGYGLYAVVLKETNDVIGMCGLLCRDSLPSTDIGFGFLPEYMGLGYAHEACIAVMQHAKCKLAINPILGMTNKENTRSIKLLNKLGLSYQKTITFNDDELLLFSTSPN